MSKAKNTGEDSPYICIRCFQKRGYDFPRDQSGNPEPVGNCYARCTYCNEYAHSYLMEDLTYLFEHLLKNKRGAKK